MTTVLNANSRDNDVKSANGLEHHFDKSMILTESGLSTPASGVWYTTNENALSPLKLTTVLAQPVGRWFEQHAIHKLLHEDPIFHDKFALALSRSNSTVVSGAATPNDSESEEETPEILAANPANWRHQDHYAVLGIARKRWRASDDDLRRAYRRKVLQHHPDKMKQASFSNADASTKTVLREESAYFKCVQNAYDLLIDSTKRRQFDSIDPTFDEAVPDDKTVVRDEQHFYDIFHPIFERNARFLQQIAQKPWMLNLGDATTADSQVERFYSAWFHFESWRSFEYWDFLDEKDNPEKADSRDERRYLERKFKARHDKKKKDDNARLVRLVELAYKLDPRMKRIRNRAKQEKEDIRLRREGEKMKSMEGENAAKEEAARHSKMQEETKRQLEEDQKKSKDILKKERQKLKKTLRQLFKCCEYFYTEVADAKLTAKEQERRADASWVRYEGWLEKICEKWSMEDFKEHVAHALRVFNGSEEEASDDNATAQQLKEEKATETIKLRVKTYIDACMVAEEQSEKSSTAPKSNNTKTADIVVPWTEREVETLILAVKSFPAGVRERWHRIAEFTAQHANAPVRTTEDVVSKSKTLLFGKEELSKKETVIDVGKRKGGHAVDEPTVRDVADTTEEPWTAEEQTMLEDALKAFPSSDPERWDHVAQAVVGKSKNACVARFKYLAERVKAKKISNDIK